VAQGVIPRGIRPPFIEPHTTTDTGPRSLISYPPVIPAVPSTAILRDPQPPLSSSSFRNAQMFSQSLNAKKSFSLPNLRQPQMQSAFPLTAPCPPNSHHLGPLKVPGWEYWLQRHPDPGFRNSLADIITFGAKIGYTGPPQYILSENLTSALNDPDTLSNDIQKKAATKEIRCVSQTSPPAPPFISSPLGLTPKSDGTWRRIHHLSAPRGSSVNDYIPKE
jgi:hypothetical protein